MPRDSQRKRLYDAETLARIEGRRFRTTEACQEYVDQVTSSPWWAMHFHHHDGDVTVPRPHGNLSRAYTTANLEEIHVAPRYRTELTLLHELAHVVTPIHLIGHGPQFARNYLMLVEKFMGKPCATKLAASFVAHGVKVAPPKRHSAPLAIARRERRLYVEMKKARAAFQKALWEWEETRDQLLWEKW